MKTVFPFISLSDMKRALSFVLLFAILIFSTSCASDKKEDDNTAAETTAVSINDVIQQFNEMNYISEKRFELEDILTFSHSEGEYLLERNSIFAIYEESQGGIIPFLEYDYKETFEGISTPFGVKIGDSMQTLIDRFGLETGFAAYVEQGGGLQLYESEKGIDLPKGGAIYFGYGKDQKGDWAFFDYVILSATMAGQLVISNSNATSSYDAVIYGCIVDEQNNVKQITVLYGDISAIMAYIA